MKCFDSLAGHAKCLPRALLAQLFQYDWHTPQGDSLSYAGGLIKDYVSEVLRLLSLTFVCRGWNVSIFVPDIQSTLSFDNQIDYGRFTWSLQSQFQLSICYWAFTRVSLSYGLQLPPMDWDGTRIKVLNYKCGIKVVIPLQIIQPEEPWSRPWLLIMGFKIWKPNPLTEDQLYDDCTAPHGLCK